MEASALQAPAGLSRLSASGPLLRLRSDEQLVALFRAGHDDAFRVMHDRYQARLGAYARQMLNGSRTDAEDAVQDVFLRAYHHLRADDRPLTLRAWLYRVAHNRCIDQLRRPVPAPADVFELNRPRTVDPTDEAQRREDLRRLVADVRRLPEQQRSALLMREMEGLSYADLAGALGVTVPAVKSLLVRARMGLAEAAEARDAACVDIREELAQAVDRGVRMPARARRHVRDCHGCRDYRDALRSADRALAGLAPGGHGLLAALAKILGIGGGGAAAGTGAAAGGGAAVLGTGAAATGAKLAAVVCCAAVVGGGAAEVRSDLGSGGRDRATKSAVVAAAAPAAGVAPAAVEVRQTAAVPAGLARPATEAADDRAEGIIGSLADADPTAAVDELSPSPSAVAELPSDLETASGGLAAPEEAVEAAPEVPATPPATPQAATHPDTAAQSTTTPVTAPAEAASGRPQNTGGAEAPAE